MTKGRSGATWGVAALAVVLLAAGCTGSDGNGAQTSDGQGTEAPSAPSAPSAPAKKATGRYATDLDLNVDGGKKTAKPDFEVQPGTEEISVTGAKPKQRLSLVDADGHRLVVLRADRYGQAHFAYLPTKLSEYQTGAKAKIPAGEGTVVAPGEGYTVRNEDTDPVQASKPFAVLGRDDHPKDAFYEDQQDEIGPTGDEKEWFGYVTMRDGVQLSVNIRLPGPPDEGPYPTVVEYSGYGPSNPGSTEPGSMIAGLLGYATVGVNMRGTGCSGGVFDVFNTSQQTDGYDFVEALARQPWAQDHKVGMVGLSYAGISQLYVAATKPPSLSAITALSVIKDPWLQQWPGGVYNSGFTKQWLQERDRQSSAGGSSWVAERMDQGDETCAANQETREQNIDFESFGRSLVRRPVASNGRDLSRLVADIEVPVYLTGAWQDEQTGPQFADMLGNFKDAPVTKFTMFNGRHPDGYTPLVLTRWYEFLEFYVHRKIPRLADGIRAGAPAVLKANFGDVDGLEFEPDRFADFDDDQYDAALTDYEAEPDVRVLFDVGAATPKPGSPAESFEQGYDAWPPADTTERSFYLDDAKLAADAPKEAEADQFANDPAAGQVDVFGDGGGDYELLAPTWDFDWTSYREGDGLAYLSAPFDEDTVLGGPGYADLHIGAEDGDADVQVSVNLVRPDGTEWHVTSGLLRVSDRRVDEKRSRGLLVDRTFAAEDAQDVPEGELVEAKVSIPSFAQVFRRGDRLRVTVSSPGRDYGTWLFDTIGKDGAKRTVGRGGDQASRIVLGVLPGIEDVPEVDYACPSLRGQACRPYVEVANTPVS